MEANAKRGVRVKALEMRPQILPDVAHVYEAFWQMSRPVGFGAGPIPMVEIACWLDEHGIEDQEDRVQFIDAIKAMDACYLNRVNKRGENDGNPKSRN